MKKLEDAKLIFDQFGFHVENQNSEPGIDDAMLSDKLTVLVNDIEIAMKRMDYAHYRGKIYKKCPNAKYAFSYKCEVKVFIICLAANEFFNARLLKDMQKVIKGVADWLRKDPMHCVVWAAAQAADDEDVKSRTMEMVLKYRLIKVPYPNTKRKCSEQWY